MTTGRLPTMINLRLLSRAIAARAALLLAVLLTLLVGVDILRTGLKIQAAKKGEA